MAPAPVFVPASTGSPIKVYAVPFQALRATHYSNSIPSRFSADTVPPTPISRPTHLSWDELSEIIRTRLRAKYNSLMSRLWNARWDVWITLFGWTSYTDALGLSTSMTSDGLVRADMIETDPDIKDVLRLQDQIHVCHELSNLHVFFSPLDVKIDEVLAKVEHLFVPSAILRLSSHRVAPSNWADGSPLSITELSSPNDSICYEIERNFITRRPHKAEYPRPHTLDLLQGISAHWGFYFSYSPNKTAEEAREHKLSQDLILAAQELGTAMDTATHSREAMARHAALAQRCFYALYLTRIIVFSRFLDRFPRDTRSKHVRSEWAVFQHNPPRMPDGDDVFSTVYRHVTRARGSVFDYKRTAEARFNTLFKRNLRIFFEKCTTPPPKVPFYLAVDEVEAPIIQCPSSGRRPACSRLGVSALFHGFDETS